MGNQQLKLCQQEYRRLARELGQRGISASQVERCRVALSEAGREGWQVIQAAYLPTGAALGCRLTEKNTERLFGRCARLMAGWLAQEVGKAGEAGLALVPAEAYHITVVNRSHYEVNEVVAISSEEKQEIEAQVRRMGVGRISVMSCGVQVTHFGRVYIKCLPCDDKILRLRNQLGEGFPQLRTNIPRMLHIKIGHLIKPLNAGELLRFMSFMERMGQAVVRRLDFDDLFTPAGRISLMDADGLNE